MKDRFDDDGEIEEYLLKSLYKSGRVKDSANIYMPQVLRRKMLSRGYVSGMRTLVVSTLEFLEEMENLESVVFYSPCKFKCKVVEKVYPDVKTILKLPTYYVSIPRNCDILTYYVLGFIDKEELQNNFIVLCITGNHKPMNPRIFYRIYSAVLKNYQQIYKTETKVYSLNINSKSTNIIA